MAADGTVRALKTLFSVFLKSKKMTPTCGGDETDNAALQ